MASDHLVKKVGDRWPPASTEQLSCEHPEGLVERSDRIPFDRANAAWRCNLCGRRWKEPSQGGSFTEVPVPPEALGEWVHHYQI